MSENIPIHVKSSADARGKRLKSLRKMADLSRKDLTLRYKISSSTIQAWEEGKAGGLTPKGADRVIAALREEGVYCTTEWLLHGIGKGPHLAERVFLKAAEPEASYQAVDQQEPNVISKELMTFHQLNSDVIDMIVSDDGMSPFYHIGDTVAGKRHYQTDIALLIGKDCIIETTAGEILLRRLRKGHAENRYALQCINLDTVLPDPVRYEVEVFAAAPVIWHRRSYQRIK